jgi:hypothetical protein
LKRLEWRVCGGGAREGRDAVSCLAPLLRRYQGLIATEMTSILYPIKLQAVPSRSTFVSCSASLVISRFRPVDRRPDFDGFHAWKNVPPWSPLHRKLQQHSTPLHNPTFDALQAGTDSVRSASTEFEPPPSDSQVPTAERPEISQEIPETPTVAVNNVRHEDNKSDNGDPSSHHWHAG